ncbi:MAG: 50S ribosomal protein L9 [Chloroflexi bacterium]|nr:50S ribosomal protein L9 [Chloroflexota bacterium]
MQVLFLEDVAPNHRAGDVKEVKNGYGRNYLIPKGMATLATKAALQQATALRAAASERRIKEASDWRVVAEELEKRPVVIKMRSGPTGRLYGSVTNVMIANELSEMTDRPIDRRGIRISSPIRQVGSIKLPIKLFEDVECEIEIQVEADTDGSEEFVLDESVTVQEAVAQEDFIAAAIARAEAEDDALAAAARGETPEPEADADSDEEAPEATTETRSTDGDSEET